MAAITDLTVSDVAARDNFSSFHRHLLSVRPEPEWRTIFGEHEEILGHRLLYSARLCRSLWIRSKVGTEHSYPLVRPVTGWLVREAVIKAERPAFAYSADTPERPGKAARKRAFNLNRDFPPWDPGPWPEGFTVSREQIYDDMGCLTGGPENESGDGC